MTRSAIRFHQLTEAEEVVQHLVDGGATAIKIALEPGGETGAPWMQPHDGLPVPTTPWHYAFPGDSPGDCG